MSRCAAASSSKNKDRISARDGLYAVPDLLGAAVVVGVSEAGTHRLAFPILGAAVCFAAASKRPWREAAKLA
jgi:hypothetical protein